MNNLKVLARQAKRRLSTDFWRQCKEDVDVTAREAEKSGKNAARVKSKLYGKVRRAIRGEEDDEFYLKVRELLDKYGEASDMLGKLTDKEYFDALSYDERQRYTMELSVKYLEALEKYRREKE